MGPTRSCTVRGANEMVDHLKGAIGVHEGGQVSKDGLFSYEEVECPGACEYAPVALLDRRHQVDLTPQKIDALGAGRRSPSPRRGVRRGEVQRATRKARHKVHDL